MNILTNTMVPIAILLLGFAGALFALPQEVNADITTLSRPPNNLGLVGYWPFDEGTGTVAGDFSGNGNHGTLTTIGSDIPIWTNGKHGRALDFTDNNHYPHVQTTFNQSLLPATIVAWVKVAAGDLQACDGAIFSRGTAVSGLNIGQCQDGTRMGYHWNSDGNAHDWTGGPLIPTDQWFLAAMVVESNQATLYAISENGTASAVNSIAHTSSLFDNLRFGMDTNRAFKGQLDDVRIYSRALTQTELLRLYDSGAVRIGASSVDLARGSSLEQGLVGHWTFDGTDALATITDRSGQGNHGYFYGGATSSAKTIGVLGQALDFNGSSNFIDFSDTPSLGLSGAISTCAWIKPDTIATGADTDIIVAYLSDTGTSPYYMAIDLDNELQFTWTNDTPEYEYWETSDNAVTTGIWQHVCAVRTDGSTVSLYVNGVARATNNTNDRTITTTTSGKINIGAAGDFDVYYFDGGIDDVRIYNRALTPAEVKQLFQLGQVKIRQ